VYRDETYPEARVTSAFANGWKQLWKNFLILILIGIVALVFSGFAGFFKTVGQIGGALVEHGDFLSVLGFSMAAGGYFVSSIYGLLVMAPLNYGVSFANLKAARNNRVDLTDMFKGFENYINAVLATLLVTVLAGIGFIFFVIPGIYIGCKLAFTPFLVVDRKMNAVDAVRESWDMTHGYAFKIFLIGLLAIPITIAGVCFFIVGLIPALMWIKLTYASLYHAITIEDETDAEMYG